MGKSLPGECGRAGRRAGFEGIAGLAALAAEMAQNAVHNPGLSTETIPNWVPREHKRGSTSKIFLNKHGIRLQKDDCS
jgi:hypothetical protein